MEKHLSLQPADELKVPVATLCAMFDDAVAAAPERVALQHLDAELTYRELGRAVAALAQRLAALVAAYGNMFAGLWYPVVIAAVSLVIGFFFLPETKDRPLDEQY